MIRATPLKIFDENQSVAQSKLGKTGGLQNHDQPIKKGLQPSAIKSTRKALSNLSTNQINIRQTPARPTSTVPLKKPITAAKSSSTKLKAMDPFYVDDFKPDEMLCTRMKPDEDYFDLSSSSTRKAFNLSPRHSLDMSWAEVSTPRDSSESRKQMSGEQDDDEYTTYLMSLVNAPMLEFPEDSV